MKIFTNKNKIQNQMYKKLLIKAVAIGVASLLILSNLATPSVCALDISDPTRMSRAVTFVSIDYNNLENQLTLLSGTENSEIDKRTILEQQIIFLNQEIEKVNSEISSWIDNKDSLDGKLDSKQIKLESTQEINVQKIHMIGAGLGADLLSNGTDVVNKLIAMQQLAETNQTTISATGQIDAERESAQQEIVRLHDRLFTLTRLLETKRFEMHNLLSENHGKTKRSSIGELTPLGTTIIHETNIDKNGILWANPCVYTRLSSPFGYRVHPVYGGWRMHNGVDLTNKSGTPICATRSGVVIDSGYDSSSGYHVVIDHLDGYKSCYLHLRDHSELKEGDVVTIGDYIGPMGTTGTSTGNHLHFGISYKGDWVDPMDYLD